MPSMLKQTPQWPGAITARRYFSGSGLASPDSNGARVAASRLPNGALGATIPNSFPSVGEMFDRIRYGDRPGRRGERRTIGDRVAQDRRGSAGSCR